jgi:iron complex transport system substrate-binding protein
MIPDPAGGRRLRAVAIALYLLCGAITCARSGDAPAPGGAARRVVTVGGPVTEIAFALGAGDRVVGVDTSSVYPERVTALPQVGYQRSLSAEGVTALSPDLVIASADAGPPAALEQLRAAGVRVAVMPNVSTIDEAARRIEAVGTALGLAAAGRELAGRVRGDAGRARERCCAVVTHAAPRAALVYARGGGTVMLAGTGTPAVAMLELAGARNAVSGFTGFKPISPESLVEAAPDILVIPSRSLASLGGESGLLAIPGVADTPAARAHRIVAMDDLLLLGFGPRLPAAIDELARHFADAGAPAPPKAAAAGGAAGALGAASAAGAAANPIGATTSAASGAVTNAASGAATSAASGAVTSAASGAAR